MEPASQLVVDPLQAVWELATASGGAVTVFELRAAGLSDHQIQYLVRRGFLRRVRRGHYLVGHAGLGQEGSWTSLVRQAGEGARLAGTAAAAARGFLPWNTSVVDIVVPSERRHVPGARLHIRPKLIELAERGGDESHILTPETALVSCAERLDVGSILRIIREGRYARVLDLAELADIARTPYLRGAGRTRECIERWEHGDQGTWSKYERMADRALPPDVIAGSFGNFEMSVGGEILPVDRVWVIEGICMEVLGPPHDEPAQQRIDRIRNAAIRMNGTNLFEVNWRDLERDARQAVEPVVRAVRAARARRT